MKPPPAFDKHTKLRGINLGNALEAPAPGNWGVTIKPTYFETIRDAGFNHVRIPVRFSAHTSQTTPYSIEPKFLNMVDNIINQGLETGLTVILDLHHYDELMVDPAGQREKFQAISPRIGSCEEVYANYPEVRPKINLGLKAMYMPAPDQIRILGVGDFHSTSDYYATLFHELVHSTGHTSRLNREGIKPAQDK